MMSGTADVRATIALALAACLAGCAAGPQLNHNPYQERAAELVAKYNARHGTHVPIPPVRVGTLPNLDEGNAYCPPHAEVCWLTINESWADGRHGQGYSMANMLPHELAHHICVYLKRCPRGNYHGREWQLLALELGVDPTDFQVATIARN